MLEEIHIHIARVEAALKQTEPVEQGVVRFVICTFGHILPSITEKRVAVGSLHDKVEVLLLAAQDIRVGDLGGCVVELVGIDIHKQFVLCQRVFFKFSEIFPALALVVFHIQLIIRG